MKLINSSNTAYLLDASLESLHTEGREWLSEIDFWSEEMSCFYKLLHRAGSPKPFPTNDLAEIDKEMLRLTSEDIAKTKKQVEAHERALVSVMRGTSLGDEAEYRQHHKTLLNELYTLQAQIKDFKKRMFSMVAH
jgi:hypothetical protein